MTENEKYRSAAESISRIERACRCQYVTEDTGDVYLNRYIIDGNDRLLMLIDAKDGTCRQITDRMGKFINFPGIEYHDDIMRYFEGRSVEEYVKYKAYVYRRNDGSFLFVWNIQPYSFDPGDSDGYGMEETVDIHLYSYIDRQGNFTEPFRLYSIGGYLYNSEPYEKPKVVFLDFDGVLNSRKYSESHPYGGLQIDESRLEMLRELIQRTDAVTVLSTSWREHWHLSEVFCDKTGKMINSLFAKHGLYIYDKTPQLNNNRLEEIEKWLRDHPYVEYFAVLDDCPFAEGMLKDRFVLTSNMRDGLDRSDVEAAVRILNGSTD